MTVLWVAAGALFSFWLVVFLIVFAGLGKEFFND